MKRMLTPLLGVMIFVGCQENAVSTTATTAPAAPAKPAAKVSKKFSADPTPPVHTCCCCNPCEVPQAFLPDHHVGPPAPTLLPQTARKVAIKMTAAASPNTHYTYSPKFERIPNPQFVIPMAMRWALGEGLLAGQRSHRTGQFRDWRFLRAVLDDESIGQIYVSWSDDANQFSRTANQFRDSFANPPEVPGWHVERYDIAAQRIDAAAPEDFQYIQERQAAGKWNVAEHARITMRVMGSEPRYPNDDVRKMVREKLGRHVHFILLVNFYYSHCGTEMVFGHTDNGYAFVGHRMEWKY